MFGPLDIFALLLIRLINFTAQLSPSARYHQLVGQYS